MVQSRFKALLGQLHKAANFELLCYLDVNLSLLLAVHNYCQDYILMLLTLKPIFHCTILCWKVMILSLQDNLKGKPYRPAAKEP